MLCPLLYPLPKPLVGGTLYSYCSMKQTLGWPNYSNIVSVYRICVLYSAFTVSNASLHSKVNEINTTIFWGKMSCFLFYFYGNKMPDANITLVCLSVFVKGIVTQEKKLNVAPGCFYCST